MSNVHIGRAGDRNLSPRLIDSMFQLRNSTFFERLQWQVRSENGRERDWYDVLDPTYMIASADGEEALGCWRLLPTTGPYMLRDIFPQLLHGKPAPRHPRVWEISRFAAAPESGKGGFGFTDVPLAMLKSLVQFAWQRGITAFVGVTTVAIERMVRKTGMHIERFGPAIKIGDAMSVSFELPIDDQAEFALWGSLQHEVWERAA